MSTTVSINGSTYNLPTQGTNPPWGEDLSSIIEALVNITSGISGTGDILTTIFNPANNVSSPANITGLSFDTGQVRSAIVNYSLNRSTVSNEASECGILLLTYNSSANSWTIAQSCAGDAGLDITINSAGQLLYTSSDMAGASYMSLLKFNAKAFTQT